MEDPEKLERATLGLIMNALAYDLLHDSKHLKGTDDGATLVPFEGHDHIFGWVGTEYRQVPNPVLFEANFQATRQSDFPCNDVHWPIMSPRMLAVLTGLGQFPHRLIPVRLVDRSASASRRYLADGSLPPEVIDDRFSAIQLTEHLDVVDWDRSTFTRLRTNPKGAWFDNLVLRQPAGGLPPLFRIAADASMLLVSAKARRALEEAGIVGISFMSIPGAHASDTSLESAS
jgi:hypothetical protein